LLIAFLSGASANPWATMAAPTPGPAVVIGSTSNGCLQGAVALPHRGTGYFSVNRQRNRAHGHPALAEFVADLGSDLAERTSRLLIVGDLSQPRGGPMPSSHRSHQSGLDVDIWFWLAPSESAALQRVKASQDPPSMVGQDGRRLSARYWTAHQDFLLQRTARDPRVDRIFVNPAIKAALCETAQGERDWLRKLRPWWGHRAHFHVRLHCPQGSPACEPQPALAAGDGCGSELAWWFTEEARRPSARAPKPKPPLPAACTALLTDT
jgi:penicillin-insensitive murein endopeptidase